MAANEWISISWFSSCSIQQDFVASAKSKYSRSMIYLSYFMIFFFFSRFNMLIISLEVKYTISSCYGSCGSTVNTIVFLPPIERIWILDLNPSSTIYFKKEFQMIHNSVINFEFNSKGHRLLMNFTL